MTSTIRRRGRPPKRVDHIYLFKLYVRGYTLRELSKEFEISLPTVMKLLNLHYGEQYKRIARLRVASQNKSDLLSIIRKEYIEGSILTDAQKQEIDAWLTTEKAEEIISKDLNSHARLLTAFGENSFSYFLNPELTYRSYHYDNRDYSVILDAVEFDNSDEWPPYMPACDNHGRNHSSRYTKYKGKK